MSRRTINILLSAQKFDHQAGARLDGHEHESGQLTIVLRGTTSLSDRRGWWLAPIGMAIWVPPKCLHSAYYSESSSVVRLLFSARSVVGLPTRCATVAVSSLLRELALEAVRQSQEANISNEIELVGKLIVAQLARRAQSPMLFVPDGRDRRLRKVIDMLRTNPGHPAKIDELAQLANTSARTLARLFVTETGMSIGRWREHLRIVCAVDRLARGQSITTTALELGYMSASSFTTLFSRLLGAPPRRYMRALRGDGVFQDPISERRHINGDTV